jgi:hypothetical protein
LLALPLWVVLGEMIWYWLSRETTRLAMTNTFWRLTLFFVVATSVLLVGGVMFGLWRQRSMGQAQAMMTLQDEQWREMRTEYMLIGRWLAWGRERRRTKERP